MLACPRIRNILVNLGMIVFKYYVRHFRVLG